MATVNFAVHFSVATNQEQLLIKGGIYFIGKPVDSNDGMYMRGDADRPDRHW